MNNWLFTLRERLTPDMRSRFEGYQSFSGFTLLTELITLDSMMCPDVVTELSTEDWDYNVQQDFRTQLFRDADYLLSRQPLDRSKHQLIAAYEQPADTEIIPTGFERCGYDIMDAYFGNSTLTNCGPIPEAFSPADVNEFGLIDNYEMAFSIRDRMRLLHPDDPHLGACDVWLLARRLPNVG